MGNAATIPHVQARAAALAALGWTGREADWIALVCLQSGVFTRAQWSYFFDDASRVGATRFTRTLLDRGVAVEDDRAIFPGGARAVHITHKPIYRALGIENVKHRRGAKATKTQVLMRRLLALDYVIERPTLGWLPTEDEKVQRFDALGIDRARLPYRVYGEEGKTQKRFFALKFPVAVDAKAATFVYVDPGLTTDSELRAWGTAHAPLWAALRARTFAVQIVAIGADPSGADRAEHGAPALDDRRRPPARGARRRADESRPGSPARNAGPRARPRARRPPSAASGGGLNGGVETVSRPPTTARRNTDNRDPAGRD